MKLYAFLGTSNYSNCKYVFEKNGTRSTSPSVAFVQTAVALEMGEALKGMTIFATKEAQEKHEKALCEEFRKHRLAEPTVVLAPAGHNQREIYELFDTLKEHIDATSPVVFDITHGYRSQPILGVMILNYLQSLSSDFELHDLVYGAFDHSHYFTPETKDRENSEYPIVSLMPLWELNAWSAAFHTFEKTGDAILLTEYAERTQNQEMKALGGPPPERPSLKSFSSALKEWQQHIELCAIPQIYAEKRYFDTLQRQLDTDWNDFTHELGRFVEPLRARVKEVVEPMYTDRWDSVDGLRAQLEIMRWMAKYERYQPFLTMASEWLHTLIALHLNIPVEELHNDYPGAAAQIGRWGSLNSDQIQELKKSCGDNAYDQLLQFGEVYGKEFYSLIGGIKDARNGVNHCWIGRSAEEVDAYNIASGTAKKVLSAFPDLLDKLRVELGERMGARKTHA